MAGEVPADREARGEASETTGAGAPFDLGDSRDLAAAVRAAYGQELPEQAGRPEVPRPPLNHRIRSGAPDESADPLAQLRAGSPRRFGFRLALPTARPRTRTLAATGGVLVALLVTAAVPLVGGAMQRPPEAAERRTPRVTTTTSRGVRSTTAFTYPPETIAGPTTTIVAPEPAVSPAATVPPVRSNATPTPATSRPRTSTTRSASRTTQPPASTTTHAPPPPPDDSGGGGSDEPPPYP